MEESRSDILASEMMGAAMEEAEKVIGNTSPNPWVGCVIADGCREISRGATQPAGGKHAEIIALERAGDLTRGATMYVTLEPCAHKGRTGPCVDAIIGSGIERVVIGIQDPDPQVNGAGIAALAKAGIECIIGVNDTEIRQQLGPYIKHREQTLCYVTLKMAITCDGKIADSAGNSKWITSQDARQDVQRLRSKSDAILVGANTVRIDDPLLTIRPIGDDPPTRQPIRVVWGAIEPRARVQPALSVTGSCRQVLRELASQGIINLLIEGGAKTAYEFHKARLVDRYIIYIAPAFFGGGGALSMFEGPQDLPISDMWRGKFVSVERVGQDIRVELAP